MHLCRIRIFPIKSLDGTAVEEARITSGGILENDRIYAVMDCDGKVVNGKRTALIGVIGGRHSPLRPLAQVLFETPPPPPIAPPAWLETEARRPCPRARRPLIS